MCFEKWFWFDIWDCLFFVVVVFVLLVYLDCNSRLVFVYEYEIIFDIFVMLFVGYYVWKGYKNMVWDDVCMVWMCGYVKVKG